MAMRGHYVRFDEKDWTFLLMVAGISRVKVSAIIRLGSLHEAERMVRELRRKERRNDDRPIKNALWKVQG